MKREAIISANNLSIGYKGKTNNVLYQDLSFRLYTGELTCLLGANGAGKSTLLRTMSAMQPSLGGSLQIKEKNISQYSEQELSQNLGLVLTEKTSAGGFTVTELVSLGRYPYTGFWGLLNAKDKNIVSKAIDDVGIAHKANSYVSELSDGERQKAMIAKALAQECPIILLDEPTAFLDVSSRIEIMNLLHSLVQTQNIAILLSTHDLEVALMLADRLWLLSPNNGLKCGVTEDIVLSDEMTRFFTQSSIVFEKESGRFRPVSQSYKKIQLKASGALKYWANNLLQRNGFEPTEDETEAGLSIEIHSATNIVLHNKKAILNLDSFSKLIDLLKEKE